MNATKPLPKSLIYELLPATEGELPTQLQRRQLPARVAERLNFDEASPLRGMVQTPTTPDGVIKDNSILRMIENSITDGALYHFHDAESGEGDVDEMLAILKPFWTAVELRVSRCMGTSNPRVASDARRRSLRPWVPHGRDRRPDLDGR